MNDALNRPLVVGGTYGYTSNNNGITTIGVGKLIKINKTKVTLELESQERAFYRSSEREPQRVNKKVSVSSIILFPLPIGSIVNYG